MDRFLSVVLAAGIGCFALAFLLSGLYPYLITDGKTPEATIEEVAAKVSPDFRLMKVQYPVAFAEFTGADGALTATELADVPEGDPRRASSEDAWVGAHAEALRRGRDLYVGEACWHCHSQYVRPVANEVQRFGRVRTPGDDNNALQRPVLWGTRRVGPDLTNVGGRRSNDWHVAHLYDPDSTSPGSIMPGYKWYFREGFQVFRRIDPEIAQRTGLDPGRRYPLPGVYKTRADAEAALARVKDALPQNLAAESERLVVEESLGPSPDALAIVAYLQWLGTWTEADREETP